MSLKNLKQKIGKMADESGFSGIVSVNGKGESFSLSRGMAERSHNVPVNDDTKMATASGTKFFTALGIGMLVDRGLISLTDNPFKYLDYDFTCYPESVTIEQLLSHSSGIPDYYDEDEVDETEDFEVAVPWHKLAEPEDYFPIMPREENKFAPGKGFSYCNSGYIFLAAVIASVSGMKYSKFIEKELFSGYGMMSSGFYRFDRLPENTASGYIEEENGWRTNIYNLPVKGGGDGGAYTIGADILKLWEAFLAGEIITKELVSKFMKPHAYSEDNDDVAYGLGLWLRKTNEGYRPYFMGYDAGVSFWSGISVDKSKCAVVISNTSEGAWPLVRLIGKEFL